MGHAMVAIAWAVLTGAAGFMATAFAAMIRDANQGPLLGVFFFGPLGSVLGYVAAERAIRAAEGVNVRSQARTAGLALGYGLLVFGVMLVLPR